MKKMVSFLLVSMVLYSGMPILAESFATDAVLGAITYKISTPNKKEETIPITLLVMKGDIEELVSALKKINNKIQIISSLSNIIEKGSLPVLIVNVDVLEKNKSDAHVERYSPEQGKYVPINSYYIALNSLQDIIRKAERGEIKIERRYIGIIDAAALSSWTKRLYWRYK